MSRRIIRGAISITFVAMFLFAFSSCSNSPNYGNGIPCDKLEEEFEKFVDKHKDCEHDDECTIVGGIYTCSCAPALVNGNGNPIRKDAAEEAMKYIDRYMSEECDYLDRPRWCDYGGYYGAICRDGKCSATGAYCCMCSDGEPLYGGEDGGVDGGDEMDEEPFYGQ